MRHDIYYVLENWAPRLTKNEIYQKLIKEIIPVTQTYHVNDIWSADHLIELLPTDQGKTIRVDSVDAKESKETEEENKKIEYSCCINGKNDTSYKATTAISEGEGTDLVYSYIEIYNLEKYENEFMKSYNKMMQVIKPSAIICYGKQFNEMYGNIKSIDPFDSKELIEKIGFDKFMEKYLSHSTIF